MIRWLTKLPDRGSSVRCARSRRPKVGSRAEAAGDTGTFDRSSLCFLVLVSSLIISKPVSIKQRPIRQILTDSQQNDDIAV